jgi:hypothetical protein
MTEKPPVPRSAEIFAQLMTIVVMIALFGLALVLAALIFFGFITLLGAIL